MSERMTDKFGALIQKQTKVRIRYLCDKDLRTHTDADIDDDVSELQSLAMRLLQDIRNRDKRIEELERDKQNLITFIDELQMKEQEDAKIKKP